MRTLFLLLTFIVTIPLSAAEMKTHRNIPYTKSNTVRNQLDVYAPATGKDHPVVLWIHGGGWRRGDKARVQRKPQAFVDKGYAFVSTNYRFVPQVTVKEMTADIAKAIKWTHEHIKEYGGDGNKIFVMGHSAGAHLSALVCTDDSYLKAEGLSLSLIKGCVPVDVSVYDIPKRLESGPIVSTPIFKQVFGNTKKTQQAYSPMTHIAKDKHIPPFLILHVASRNVTKVQSHWFADQLKKAGVSAKVVAAPGTTHGTINSNLGLAKDKPTQEVFTFMEEALIKKK